jgi:hypothetical protein
MSRRYLGALACLALVIGCDNATQAPTSPDGATMESVLKTAEAGVGAASNAHVYATARMIALGLAHPEVRAAVRDAMRSSLLTEHKLAFHEFVVTPAGRALVQEAARASGTTISSVKATVRRLPPLDFYVPVRAHRLGWRGTADYFVGTNLAGKPSSSVFTPSGEALVANLDKLATGRSALFMLQSAERKSRRIKPQPAVPGLTIQDPGDGQLSGTFITVDASGRSISTDLAELMHDQVEPAATCGRKCPPPPPPPTPKTRLNRLEVFEVCDNGFCWEGNEFEFTTTRPGTAVRDVIKVEDVPSTAYLTLSRFLISTTSPAQGNLVVAVKETDFSSPDDIWAYVTYNPNFVGDITLTASDNNRYWPMKQRPHVGVFDDYRLSVRIDWF